MQGTQRERQEGICRQQSVCSLGWMESRNKHPHCCLFPPSDLCWCCLRAEPNQNRTRQPSGNVRRGQPHSAQNAEGIWPSPTFWMMGKGSTVAHPGAASFSAPSSPPLRADPVLTRTVEALVSSHFSHLCNRIPRAPHRRPPPARTDSALSPSQVFVSLTLSLDITERCFACFKLCNNDKMIKIIKTGYKIQQFADFFA